MSDLYFNSQSMKRVLIYLPAILVVGFVLSCSGSKEKQTSVTEKQFSKTSITDSVEPDTQEPKENQDIKPKINVSTKELQLAHMNTSPNRDLYEAGILIQMAEDAPDYCRQILESDGKRFIIVDKAKMKLFLYDPYGRVEKSYGIACAKNFGTKHKKGDSRTTEGIFKVKGVFDSTNWLFTDDNGYTSPTKGVYGPRFIRLDIPYIGIHGTGSPGSIGKRCSHGCIRVTNANILELVKYVEEGMPVIISPGPRDLAVNNKEGYNILAVVTEPGGTKASPCWTKEPSTTALRQKSDSEVLTDQPDEMQEMTPTEENKSEEKQEAPIEAPTQTTQAQETEVIV